MVQGGATAVFHGRIGLKSGYYYPVQFTAGAGDTLDGGFRLTGQMGEVMQESAGIAYTFARRVTAEQGLDADWWRYYFR